ncbi:hypothetical protein LCGC14_1923300 [marine sediment metagenome]|uniref:Uncharacterized protein n=1 Tax=marine sediment metagenome TaxID=412755 RepID=A0A0F9GDI7_9ZZZZ
MKRTYIEWTVEELVGDDIVDSNFAASYAEVRGMVAGKVGVFRFGLVRDYSPPDSQVMERSWAYIVHGLLAAEFTDAYDNPVAKVAVRYFRETQNSI